MLTRPEGHDPILAWQERLAGKHTSRPAPRTYTVLTRYPPPCTTLEQPGSGLLAATRRLTPPRRCPSHRGSAQLPVCHISGAPARAVSRLYEQQQRRRPLPPPPPLPLTRAGAQAPRDPMRPHRQRSKRHTDRPLAHAAIFVHSRAA